MPEALAPPQPVIHAELSVRRTSAEKIQRRRVGTPKKRIAASAAPPAIPNSSGLLCALVPAVVLTVKVAVAAAVLAMLTEAGRLHVGALTGFAMLVDTAQARFTCPVKPLAGVTEMAAVLPVVAPAATAMEPPLLRLKLPGVGVEVPVTVALTLVVAVTLPVVASVPVTVTT